MSLLSLIILLVVVGVVLWAVNRFIPMESNIKVILNVAVAIFVVIYLLQATGVWSNLSTVKIG